MARTATPMDWEELKRSQLHDRYIGYTFWAAGVAVFLVELLKIVYGAVTTDPLLSSMFSKSGLPQRVEAVITWVWWIPGVPLLWQLDYLYAYVLGVGLAAIGAIFLQRDKKKSQTLKNADQRAQEDHLTDERRGYPKLGYPQPPNVVTVMGDMRESVIGTGSGATVTINSPRNNPPNIAELVSRIYTHRSELTLTPSQLMQFEAQLRGIQEQLRAQTPNHSRLYESMLSIRHIVEAGATHMLVGHWGDILHALQRITGP